MIFLSKDIFSTPLGNLTAVASNRGLMILSFEEDMEFLNKKIIKYFPQHTFNQQFSETLKKTNLWLESYFSKNFSKIPMPPLDLQGTSFAIQAWQALLRIRIGATQSYGELAKIIGFPKASRAVGRIMGQNPIVILVPCHRVIGASGKLTGYGGGLKRKEWLLNHEKAYFNKNPTP